MKARYAKKILKSVKKLEAPKEGESLVLIMAEGSCTIEELGHACKSTEQITGYKVIGFLGDIEIKVITKGVRDE